MTFGAGNKPSACDFRVSTTGNRFGQRCTMKTEGRLIPEAEMGAARQGLVRWALVLVVGALACSTTEFKSTWRDPTARPVALQAQPVAAFLITSNETTRRAGEDILARELSARGVRGIPGYQLTGEKPVRDSEALRTEPPRGRHRGNRDHAGGRPPCGAGLRPGRAGLRLDVRVLGIRLGHDGASRLPRDRHHRLGRDAGLFASAGQAALGWRQRDDQSEQPGLLHQRGRQAAGEEIRKAGVLQG